MRLKRIARAAVPLLAAILISWPFGFPVLVVFLGAVFSYLTYQYWEDAYATGEKVYRIFRPSVHITEVKLPSPPRPDAPTVPLAEHEQMPITGHLVSEPLGVSNPVVAPDILDEPDFVIGKTEDGRTITLDSITSLGVGGVPGSGKTVSMVGLATQSVVKYKGQVRVLVVDPHMHTGSNDALSARMAPLSPFYLHVPDLPNPVSGSAALLKWIKWMTNEARSRLGGRAAGEKLVLIADEFTALLDDPEISGPLTELLLLINEQSRKVGIFALVASPSWKSSRISGTDIRNTIATFMVHNMPPAIARMLIPYAEAERSNTLAKGQAIFSSFGQVEVVRVQMMTSSDITRCVQPFIQETLQPETEILPEPTIAEVRSIWETYMILNKDLSYSEESVIRALAIDVYGPGDPLGQEKVRKALKLGEEHL